RIVRLFAYSPTISPTSAPLLSSVRRHDPDFFNFDLFAPVFTEVAISQIHSAWSLIESYEPRASLIQRETLKDQFINQPLLEVRAVQGHHELIGLIGTGYHHLYAMVPLEHSDRDPARDQIRLEPFPRMIEGDLLKVSEQFLSGLSPVKGMSGNERRSLAVAF